MAPTPSLYTMALRTAHRNIDKQISDLGDLPPHLALPILSRLTNPQKLAELERLSPQLLGHTGDLWLKFIRRDCPGYESKPHRPSDPQKWGKVYRKLKREADEEERQAEEMLREKMAGIRKKDEEGRVKAPTKAIMPKTKGKGVAMQFQRSSDSSGLRFTTGTKTKNPMQAVRRQVAESRLTSSGVLARPMGMLNGPGNTKPVIRAPRHMIEDRQAEKARVSAATAAAHTSTPSIRPTSSIGVVDDLRLREMKLKAAKEGRAAELAAKRAAPATIAPSIERPAAQERAPGIPQERTYHVPRPQAASRLSPPLRSTASPAGGSASASPAPAMLKRKAAPTVLLAGKRVKR